MMTMLIKVLTVLNIIILSNAALDYHPKSLPRCQKKCLLDYESCKWNSETPVHCQSLNDCIDACHSDPVEDYHNQDEKLTEQSLLSDGKWPCINNCEATLYMCLQQAHTREIYIKCIVENVRCKDNC